VEDDNNDGFFWNAPLGQTDKVIEIDGNNQDPSKGWVSFINLRFFK